MIASISCASATLAGRRAAVAPLVVARGDTPSTRQATATGRSRRRQAPDQPERYFGPFSRAKNAAARLRISFSISSRRLSRRSCDQLFALVAGQTLLVTLIDIGLAIQRRRHDSQIPRSFAI